jgi:hypothetical protein
VTIATDDIKALRNKPVAKGIDVGSGALDQDGGNRELYVKDRWKHHPFSPCSHNRSLDLFKLALQDQLARQDQHCQSP